MTTQKQFLEQVSELRQKNTDLIAENGKLRQTIGENERAHSEELNQYLQAGMLLMRECCAIGGTPGIKALTPFVDKGILGLNPETLTVLARGVLAELRHQRDERSGLKQPTREQVMKAHSEWVRLGNSPNKEDREKVIFALRGMGVSSPDYMPLSTEERADLLINHKAYPPGF